MHVSLLKLPVLLLAGATLLLAAVGAAPAREPVPVPATPSASAGNSSPLYPIPAPRALAQPEADDGEEMVEIPSPWQMVTDGFDSLEDDGNEDSKARISDEALGILEVPDRPPLLLEWNGDFLGRGELSQGIELPTGAIWRPSLWVFGTNRVAFQFFEDHKTTNSLELVERLDLFTQLNLSGTERLLLGLRPFDREKYSQRRYTSYDFTAGQYIDGINIIPQTLLFEGDFGEIFPNLDPFDTQAIDYGFSIGRQPVFVQSGIFIAADFLDAVSVTRNTLAGNGVLNSRMTFMFAPGSVHRNDGLSYYVLARDAQMYAVFTETDFASTTINANFAYVHSDNPTTGDGLNFGTSAAQRLQPGNETINSTFHALGCLPTGQETLATGKGLLLVSELSTAPAGTENHAYFNSFWAIGNYVSPTRGVQMGGPLAPVAGILFAKPQIGVFGSPISNLAEDVAGASVGYQYMWDGIKKQLTWEIGGRQSTSSAQTSAIGIGALYQQAVSQHTVFILNAAVVKAEGVSSPDVGARMEILTKF